MAKEKKKTPLPDGAILNAIGIYFYEDIPEPNIDGKPCTEYAYKLHLEDTNNKYRIYSRNIAIKKIIKQNYI